MSMDEKKILSLNREAWDKVAKKYNESHYSNFNPLIEYFCSNLPKNGWILDVGSGTGLPHTKFLVEKGFNVLGIDISSEMVSISRNFVPQATFKVMSMTDIDFHERFDGVFANYSMLLLDLKLFKDVTGRVYRALKKGGVFYLSQNEQKRDNLPTDEDCIVSIMGEPIYSRGYKECEILDAILPLGMKCLEKHHQVLHTEEFGTEYNMSFVFQKVS
jgi:SAM-dependent methyltransferase